MLGREGDPGIMYLTTMELYRRLEAHQEKKQFEVLISYQEVGPSPPWDWVASSLILTTTSRGGGVSSGGEGGRKWADGGPVRAQRAETAQRETACELNLSCHLSSRKVPLVL